MSALQARDAFASCVKNQQCISEPPRTSTRARGGLWRTSGSSGSKVEREVLATASSCLLYTSDAADDTPC
eukprot:5358052-Pleurochrysis_carterae.AAC.1